MARVAGSYEKQAVFSGGPRELTWDELELVDGAINWGSVAEAATIGVVWGAIGGAVNGGLAGAVTGAVASLMDQYMQQE